MEFKINVFGKICRKCAMPFRPEQWVNVKAFMKVDNIGDLRTSTGFIEFEHQRCHGG